MQPGDKRAGRQIFSTRKPGTAMRILMLDYKRSAANNGRAFELTEQEFKDITSSDCAYCGAAPSKRIATRAGEVYLYNGVDRIQNELGYSRSNSAACCFRCNTMKSNMPLEDFVAHIARILERWGTCAPLI